MLIITIAIVIIWISWPNIKALHIIIKIFTNQKHIFVHVLCERRNDDGGGSNGK